MRELSLHILDIVQNAITAGSDLIAIDIHEDIANDILSFTITDNGKGMSQELLDTVCDPFKTSRLTRKIGLGISLLKAAAERCDGGLEIVSEVGKGTSVKTHFIYSHIDRSPLGDMVETILTLVSSNPSIDFVYHHKVDDREYLFETKEIKKVLKDVPINTVEVIIWMKENLNEGIISLYGGVSS